MYICKNCANPYGISKAAVSGNCEICGAKCGTFVSPSTVLRDKHLCVSRPIKELCSVCEVGMCRLAFDTGRNLMSLEAGTCLGTAMKCDCTCRLIATDAVQKAMRVWSYNNQVVPHLSLSGIEMLNPADYAEQCRLEDDKRWAERLEELQNVKVDKTRPFLGLHDIRYMLN